MGKHRTSEKCSLYKLVNGDWDNWYIELYEEYPCNNKEQLEKREGEVIREIATINKNIAGRTMKEYYQDNRDEIIEHNKKYYQDNRDEIAKKNKKYREENLDEIRERKKEKCKCDVCGCNSTSSHIKRHQRSLKCLNAKKNNTE